MEGPESSGTSGAAPESAPEREPVPHPKRRRLLRALVVLYAGSIVAAAILLWRGDGGGAKAEFYPKKHLLSVGREDSVGWVSIRGIISQGSSGNRWERGMDMWSRRIKALSEKSEVKAIVVDINSPGGSVAAVQELYQVILRVRNEKKKPVVALIGDVGASGGYYLAAACDRVVAHPGSLLGSIGVIFNTLNIEQLFSKIGIKTDPIKSGKLKDIGSSTRPMTKEERELLQGIIDDAYGQFLAAVAQGRKLPMDKLRPLADGRIFTGQQALSLGLVDELGGAHEALSIAGKLGGITGTPKILRDAEALGSVLELLDAGLSGFLRPEAAWLGLGTRDFNYAGLEYRWMGFGR